MTWEPHSGCYRCGDISHFIADCPVPKYPVEVTPSQGSARTALPPPVPAFPPADYAGSAHRYAEAVRADMGWPEPGSDKAGARQVANAAGQVRESRAQRLAHLD